MGSRGGIPKLGAGSRWLGSKLHRGEEEEKEEEENSIARAQPAPGAKSLQGVWEQGEFGALRPSFHFVSPCAMKEKTAEMLL